MSTGSVVSLGARRIGDRVGHVLPDVRVSARLLDDGGARDQTGFLVDHLDLAGHASLLHLGAVLRFEPVPKSHASTVRSVKEYRRRARHSTILTWI